MVLGARRYWRGGGPRVGGEPPPGAAGHVLTGPAPQVQQLERSIGLKDLALADLEQKVRDMEAATFDGVLIWKIPGFAKKRQEAVAGRTPAIFSPGTGLQRAPELLPCRCPRPLQAGGCPADARGGCASPRGWGTARPLRHCLLVPCSHRAPSPRSPSPPSWWGCRERQPHQADAPHQLGPGCWLLVTLLFTASSWGSLWGSHCPFWRALSRGRGVVPVLLPGSSRLGPSPQLDPGTGDVPRLTLILT